MAHSWIMLTVAFSLAGAQDIAATKEQKEIQELYGAGIAKVRLTREAADDVELAQQMLTLAKDTNQAPPFRNALALAVLDLVLPLGTAESTQAATDALVLAGQVATMPELTRLKYQRDIAVNRYTKAAALRPSPEERASLGRSAVDRTVAYAEAMARNGEDPRNVRAELTRAQDLAGAAGLTELRDSIADKIRQQASLAALQQQLDQAAAALKTAEAEKNTAAIKSASLRLGMLYLQLQGDVEKAAPLLAKAEYMHAQAVADAAAFQAKPDAVAPAKLLPAAEALATIAEPIKEEGRKVLGRLGLGMVEVFLVSDPPAADKAKAQTVQNRLAGIVGQTFADAYLDELKKGYEGLNARATVLDIEAGRIRVEYRFASSKELPDFVIANASDWSVASERGILVGRQTGRTPARAATKLIFDAAKPLSIEYRVSGQNSLAVLLEDSQSLPFVATATPYTFGIGTLSNFTAGGISGPGGEALVDTTLRAQPEAIYACSIAWDGKGGVTWTINGRAVQWSSAPQPLPKYIRPALQAGTAAVAYDDVIIEGVVVLSPAPATQPAQPPATPPAATQPIRRPSTGGTRPPGAGTRPGGRVAPNAP